jgi:acylphosphatase
MSPAGTARCHALAAGLVQGVFFRRFVCDEARTLGLTGMVWNRRDGRVEVIAEGPRADLERLVARLRAGPPAASVRAVEVSWEEPAVGLEGFKVEYR